MRLRFRLLRVDERDAIHLVIVAELRLQGQHHQIEAVAALVRADFEIRVVGGELRLQVHVVVAPVRDYLPAVAVAWRHDQDLLVRIERNMGGKATLRLDPHDGIGRIHDLPHARIVGPARHVIGAGDLAQNH